MQSCQETGLFWTSAAWHFHREDSFPFLHSLTLQEQADRPEIGNDQLLIHTEAFLFMLFWAFHSPTDQCERFQRTTAKWVRCGKFKWLVCQGACDPSFLLFLLPNVTSFLSSKVAFGERENKFVSLLFLAVCKHFWCGIDTGHPNLQLWVNTWYMSAKGQEITYVVKILPKMCQEKLRIGVSNQSKRQSYECKALPLQRHDDAPRRHWSTVPRHSEIVEEFLRTKVINAMSSLIVLQWLLENIALVS